MNADYSYKNFSLNNLTFDAENDRMILNQGGEKKQFQVRMMGKNLNNFAMTTQQKEALGAMITRLLSNKLDFSKGIKLETLTITNQGIKMHTLGSSPIDITFTASEKEALSNIFADKIPSKPKSLEQSTLDPNRVTADTGKRPWSVKSFFDGIAQAFSSLVGFFQKPKVDVAHLNIDFVEVIKGGTPLEQVIRGAFEEEEVVDETSKPRDKTLDELLGQEEQPPLDRALSDKEKSTKPFDPEKLFDDYLNKPPENKNE